MKHDAERQQYELVVLGEEPHLAYNRVGLSTYFEHRKVEELYLNPQEWVSWLLIAPN
jgi:nitrite reductase (NAD(P)H)